MSRKDELDKLRNDYERRIEKLKQARDKQLVSINVREADAKSPALKEAIARDRAAAHANFERLIEEARKSYEKAKSLLEGK